MFLATETPALSEAAKKWRQRTKKEKHKVGLKNIALPVVRDNAGYKRIRRDNMRRFAFALLVGTVIGAGSMISKDAVAASADGTANVTIAAPISITSNANLEFGSVGSTTAGGTVAITSAGARTVSGVTDLGGTGQAGQFTVTGEGGLAYTIGLPTSATLTSGTDTMSVDTFSSSVGTASTLSGAGTESFTVGATLNVGANQASGSYTGTYTVTVNYQ